MLFGYIIYQVAITEALIDASFGRTVSFFPASGGRNKGHNVNSCAIIETASGMSSYPPNPEVKNAELSKKWWMVVRIGINFGDEGSSVNGHQGILW